MTSVTSSGVSGSASSQAFRLALLVKLFQTNGKSDEGGKSRPLLAAAPPPPPPHNAQVNTSAGLASMYEALQAPNTSSVSDLLSRLLEAVDADGDGAISADELQAVTELTTKPISAPPTPAAYTAMIQKEDATRVLATPMAGGSEADSVRKATQSAMDQRDAVAQMGAEQTLTRDVPNAPARSAFETLFQAMSLILPQTKDISGLASSLRYTNVLQSLANAM